MFTWLPTHSPVMPQGPRRRTPCVFPGAQAAYLCNWVLQGLVVAQVLHLKFPACQKLGPKGSLSTRELPPHLSTFAVMSLLS